MGRSWWRGLPTSELPNGSDNGTTANTPTARWTVPTIDRSDIVHDLASGLEPCVVVVGRRIDLMLIRL
jgi:hypothetical protein